jgi:hypothetical protein
MEAKCSSETSVYFQRTTLRYIPEDIVAYLPQARTVDPEKQPLLGNGCVTRNNRVNVGSGVFCAVRPKAI